MRGPALAFSVNGQPVRTGLDGQASLLHLLRHELGLTGTRLGCGEGLCGSCTVWVDGHAMPSCDTPLWSLQGKQVTTIEGLGSPERPHAVQAALLEEQAGQCGFCLPGIAMAAAALLQNNPQPSETEIRAALQRNLCRCGVHGRVVKAVQRAAELLRAGAGERPA